MVEVTDSGPGITEENIARVFQPFFTTKPVGEGTGLGLSICFGILKAHGGHMRVESQPGTRTTFTCEFPLRPAAPEGHSPAQPSGSISLAEA